MSNDSGHSDNQISGPSKIAVVLYFYLVIGLVVAYFSTDWFERIYAQYTRPDWTGNPLLWALLLALGTIFVVVPGTLLVKKRIRTLAPTSRVAWTLIVAPPLALIAIVLIIFLAAPWNIVATRCVFLAVAALLPALLYYLFIANRRMIIVDEFVSALVRLGLIREPALKAGETVHDSFGKIFDTRERQSYLERFEAVYGRLTDTDIRGLFDSRGKEAKVDGGGGLAGVLRTGTAVPIVVATILIGLGWLITLPPWEPVQIALSQESASVSGATGTSAGPATVGAEGRAAATRESTTTLHALPTVLWRSLVPKQTPVTFAFLGAYFFILQMLFRRYVRRDMSPSAYVGVTMRIVLALIGVWVIDAGRGIVWSGLTDDDMLIFAFVVGVFPKVAWQVISSAARKFWGWTRVIPTMKAAQPLSDLDGLTVWHESRFEEEDIENVPNMASTDIVDLLLNTRFPPDRVIDWVDQAILYRQIGPANADLKSLLDAHAIRRASALIVADEAAVARDEAGVKTGLQDGIAERLAPADPALRARLRTLCDTIAINPKIVQIRAWQTSRSS